MYKFCRTSTSGLALELNTYIRKAFQLTEKIFWFHDTSHSLRAQESNIPKAIFPVIEHPEEDFLRPMWTSRATCLKFHFLSPSWLSFMLVKIRRVVNCLWEQCKLSKKYSFKKIFHSLMLSEMISSYKNVNWLISLGTKSYYNAPFYVKYFKFF